MIKKNFNDLKIGDTSLFAKTVTDADVFAFAGICGDFNPLHVNEEYAKKSMFGARIAHGMLSASLIDYTLTNLVGLGGVHLSQFVKFMAPVKIGDTIQVESVITDLDSAKKRLKIKSTLTNQEGTIVLTGDAEGMLP